MHGGFSSATMQYLCASRYTAHREITLFRRPGEEGETRPGDSFSRGMKEMPERAATTSVTIHRPKCALIALADSRCGLHGGIYAGENRRHAEDVAEDARAAAGDIGD